MGKYAVAGWYMRWLGGLCLMLLAAGPGMAAGERLEILAAGDVLLGGRMLEAPAVGQLFGPLTRKRLEQADIFLWNCEVSGPSSVSKENTFVFHAEGRFFPQMDFANGAACTANNHVFDGLEEGAARLLEILDSVRIRHNGLHVRTTYAPLSLLPGRTPSLYLLTGSPMSQIGSGPRIVTLSYPQLLERIRALRAQEPAAWIIVYTHDGTEGLTEASPRQRQWADWFARAGADIILFAHSHCYGPVEILEDTPRRTLVAWGLGNFLFGGNRGWRNRQDVRLLRICLDTETGEKDAGWLYGTTRNWNFSLYRLNEDLLMQAHDLLLRAVAMRRQLPAGARMLQARVPWPQEKDARPHDAATLWQHPAAVRDVPKLKEKGAPVSSVQVTGHGDGPQTARENQQGKAAGMGRTSVRGRIQDKELSF